MPFQKGHKGYKKKGTKNAITLLREERRAIFEEEMSQIWRKKIHELPASYMADQFMGKAPDHLDVEITKKLIKLDE